MWIMVIWAIWLLCISIMDVRSCKIPIGMLVFGGGFAIAVLAYQCASQEISCYEIIKGMIPGGLLLVTAYVTKKAGYGDGIVLLLLGMALGGDKSLLIFGLSLLLISVWSLILLVFHKAGRNTKIPYLPFLTAAFFIMN